MQIVPFKVAHFRAITPQPAQSYIPLYAVDEELAHLELKQSFTGLVDGKPVWCFGWWEVYQQRAVMWAYIGADAGPHFTAIHRHSKAIIDALPHRRIETEVDCEFEAGHRWARMLGLTCEVPRLRGHRIDGGDAAIYSRVR